MIAMPSDRQKNACPSAAISTLPTPTSCIRCKSNLNKNSAPLAKSILIALYPTINNRIKANAGIMIFDAFSIPADTPPATISAVNPINAVCHNVISVGFANIVSKILPVASALRPPNALIPAFKV